MLTAQAFIPIAILVAALEASAAQKPIIKLDVDLVLVPVTVTDRRGATVGGLHRDQFRVYEDRIEQHIVSFSSQDAPASVGLIFDLSGSMKNKLAEAVSSTRAFFDMANPEDEAFLMTFASSPEVRITFTADFGGIQSSLAASRASGRTALVDAVHLGLRQMRTAHNLRRALVVVSDGMDNHSRYSKPELMRAAVEADVQIYTIAVVDPAANRKPIELQDERRGMFLLDDLGAATGGLGFAVRNPDDVKKVAGRIGHAMRTQYVLGYQAPNGRTEKWRRIHVKLDVPNTRLYARTGYYAR